VTTFALLAPTRISWLCGSLLVFLLPSASAQERGDRQDIVLGDSCVTADCHAGYNAGNYVHGPTALDRCDACHATVTEGEHAFKMVREGASLCLFCHDSMPQREFEHGPVAAEMCTACHDPHRAEFPGLLKEDPGGPLCYSCHEQSDLESKEYVHAPVVAGECLQCHDPHTSDHPMMLNRQGKDLCFSCHTETRDLFLSEETWHAPVSEDCVLCHDPHSADYPRQVKDIIPDLCWGCHQELQHQVGDASNVHSAITIERKCLNCHDPHASNHLAILKESVLDTCLGCHDQEIEQPGEKPLQNMKALLDESKFLHGPIVQGNCVACHLPHAASTFRRLVDVYPPDFYAPFDLAEYGLCFSCHDKDLVLKEQTSTLTNFRHGVTNLHFVHVNREKKGRTCRACHAIHGSEHEFHIRDQVPFGGWEIPINFEVLQDGGSCAPGCHKPREYLRNAVTDK